MQFKVLTAFFALAVPAVMANPMPGKKPSSGAINNQGSGNLCSSGGTVSCCNGDGLLGLSLNCLLGNPCSNGDVFCCNNNNQQQGYLNFNEGNCHQQIADSGSVLNFGGSSH